MPVNLDPRIPVQVAEQKEENDAVGLKELYTCLLQPKQLYFHMVWFKPLGHPVQYTWTHVHKSICWNILGVPLGRKSECKSLCDMWI